MEMIMRYFFIFSCRINISKRLFSLERSSPITYLLEKYYRNFIILIRTVKKSSFRILIVCLYLAFKVIIYHYRYNSFFVNSIKFSSYFIFSNNVLYYAVISSPIICYALLFFSWIIVVFKLIIKKFWFHWLNLNWLKLLYYQICFCFILVSINCFMY